MRHDPEPWESAAAGPAVTIDGPAGQAEIWLLGPQRYRVKAPSGELVVEGFQRARRSSAQARGLSLRDRDSGIRDERTGPVAVVHTSLAGSGRFLAVEVRRSVDRDDEEQDTKADRREDQDAELFFLRSKFGVDNT
jgi:hypothetical protein